MVFLQKTPVLIKLVSIQKHLGSKQVTFYGLRQIRSEDIPEIFNTGKYSGIRKENENSSNKRNKKILFLVFS